jgi:hypothetical protein
VLGALELASKFQTSELEQHDKVSSILVVLLESREYDDHKVF